MKKAIVSILTILLAVACSRKKNDITPQAPVPAEPLSLSFAGKTNTYNKLKFTSNADTGSTFLWTFGDGDSSTEAEPYHTYKLTGNYVVSLTAGKQTSNQSVSIGSTASEVEGTYTNVGEILGSTSNYATMNHEAIAYTTVTSPVKFIVHNVTDTTVEVIDTFYSYYAYNKYKLRIDTSLITDSTITFSGGKQFFLKYNFQNNHLYFDMLITGVASGNLFLDSYKLR